MIIIGCNFPSCTFRTINDFFGSRYVTTNGILLNNEMDDFSISTNANPNEVNELIFLH